MLKSLCFCITLVLMFIQILDLFSIYGCTWKTRLKKNLMYRKRYLDKICFKARYCSYAELLNDLNALKLYVYSTVELPKFFPETVCGVLPIDCLNTLSERKVSNVQIRQTQLNQFYRQLNFALLFAIVCVTEV